MPMNASVRPSDDHATAVRAPPAGKTTDGCTPPESTAEAGATLSSANVGSTPTGAGRAIQRPRPTPATIPVTPQTARHQADVLDRAPVPCGSVHLPGSRGEIASS